MGRRALRKIDPAIQYAAWLLEPEQLPRPWNGVAVFPAIGPLEVELGSGKGLFLAQAAQAHPDHDYLGIEVSRKYAHYAAARLARLQLVNTRVVHGEGVRIFHEVLPSDGLTAVHVYFPDPWWKARHKKRRVMNEAFLSDVERTLAAGGSLHFWTDVEEYFEATVELVAAATKLSDPVLVAEKPPEHDLDYRTHFERRTRLHGDRVFRAEFHKRS